ncbi:MAG: hypothetical protein CMP20_04585 [Rickettsiales bacterium]|nr:hypothetical protein [Rickettsiales bacterium]
MVSNKQKTSRVYTPVPPRRLDGRQNTRFISPQTLNELRQLGVGRVRLLLNADSTNASPPHRRHHMQTSRQPDYVEIDIPSGFKSTVTTSLSDLELSMLPDPVLAPVVGRAGPVPYGPVPVSDNRSYTDGFDLETVVKAWWPNNTNKAVWFSTTFKTNRSPEGREVKAAAVFSTSLEDKGTLLRVLEAYHNNDGKVVGRLRSFYADNIMCSVRQVPVDAKTSVPII